MVITRKKSNTQVKAKALVLFSGGLDSRLVVSILQEQGIEVICLNFILPFGCGCCSNSGCNMNFCQTEKVKLIHIDCTRGREFRNYMKILEKPKYGFGRGLNPCINCRIFMLKKAKALMKKLNADFIATGEVLGQRPMSQHRRAMENIEKDAVLVGKILRPLSAKLFSETLAEKEKLVDRTKLFAIHGRARKKQIELANKFKIKYPMPAGGCLLCDKRYSFKLADLIKDKKVKKEVITYSDIVLLDGFRHFRAKGRIILGKNQTDNDKLEQLNTELEYNIMFPLERGPTALYESKKDRVLVKEMIEAFSSPDLKEREKFDSLRIIKE